MDSRRVKSVAMAATVAGALVVVSGALVTNDYPRNRSVVSSTLRATAREHPRSDGWAMTTNLYQISVAKFTPAGTVRAMTDKLPYLKELGIRTLWLMPVYRTTNEPGYDVIDHQAVDPRYGTNQDLQAFVAAAHGLHVRVLLSLDINDTSSQHPWFIGSDSQRHDDWYVWNKQDRGWANPWDSDEPVLGKTWFKDPRAELDRNHDGDPHDDDYFYCAFCETNGGATIADTPDLNWRAALQQLENGQPSGLFDEVEAIMRQWVVYVGADGFVAHGARFLVENGKPSFNRDQPETHRIWQELQRRLTRMAPSAVLLADASAENYERLRGYYGSPEHKEFQGVLHSGYQTVLMDSVKNGWRSAHFFPDLYAIQSHLPYDSEQRRLLGQDFVFLSNDSRKSGDRVASQLGGNQAQTKLAASVYLLLSGNPVIYYGEEYGMRNTAGAEGDEAVRGPMDWNEVARQRTEPTSVYQHYARLLRLRERYDAIHGGRMLVVPSKNENDTAFDGPWAESGRVSLMREFFDERILVVSNLFDVDQNVTLDLGGKGLPSLADGMPVTSLMGGGTPVTVTSGNLRGYPVGNIPPNGTKVLFLGPLPARYQPLTLYETPLR